jgi:hypothetical protein
MFKTATWANAHPTKYKRKRSFNSIDSRLRGNYN